MKISQTMQDALNKQITQELAANYLYLSMAAWFDAQTLFGFATWMKSQAEEEYRHAIKIYDYIYDRNGVVTLQALPAPETAWESPLHAIQAAHDHECKVSRMIDNLTFLARKENDLATERFLQWFLDEQVEEERSTQDIVDKLTYFKGSQEVLYALDEHLATRKPKIFTAPARAGE